jgi:carbamate kinase
VERAAVGFGRLEQRWLDRISTAEARDYLARGEFPAGSMGPKIEAAIAFVEHGGSECIITSTQHVVRAMRGESGTHIVAS